jgi:phosphopantothenoylcysteine decarboxylase/phosphopantothenate--cysteine ligase
MLQGKKILLGISGSIAAYKTPALVRLLVKAGAEVKVVMTPAATDFVAPLTLSTLTGNDVLHQLSENESWSNHVMLGRWADVMLIAPLSCNTLAKMSTGACDNLLTAIYLSSVCPVVAAPAMDEDMWHHPATQKNIQIISSYGNQVIPVGYGELASGLIGAGRMAEPEEILSWLHKYFIDRNQLTGKKILITAGPTQEALDPVRFLSNHSTGKMGVALAHECANRGAEVFLVCGPTAEKINPGIQLTRVQTATEMDEACQHIFPAVDIAIMSAAVADYTIAAPAKEKIKKSSDSFLLELVKTKDILRSLGTIKKANQLLVGFALETDNEKSNALAKMESKNADFMVLNSMRDSGAGFGGDTNKISIFDRKGNEYNFGLKSKREVAADIINTIIK